MEEILKLKELIFSLVFFSVIFVYVNGQDDRGISQEYIDKIIDSVEKVRGVKFKDSIGYEVIDREEMLKLIKKEVSIQYGKDEIKYTNIILKLLKLVEEDFDLENFLYKLYEEQAGGLYDPRTKRLYISDWIPSEMLDIVLFHELNHAIDDQYYGLEEYALSKGSSDAKAARLAVVEGIGTYFMLIYTFEKFGVDFDQMKGLLNFDALYQMELFDNLAGMEFVSKAPKFIRKQMLFPYFKGGAFIDNFIEKNSVNELNRLYKNPPLSTEQIIHFDKYGSDEPEVIEVKLNDKWLKGWREIYRDDMGEIGLNLMLSYRLSNEEADKAAEGWDGDHVVLLEKDNKYAMILKVLWDNKDDAIEFSEAFKSWFGSNKAEDKIGAWMKDGDLNCVISNKGAEVIIILGEIEEEISKSILIGLMRDNKK